MSRSYPTWSVTLVQYGDFECAACVEAFPVVRSLQSALGARLRFVFRHFPQPGLHPQAERAAWLAEGAAAAGRFWQMHEGLFERRGRLDDATLRALGARSHLSPARIDAALSGAFRRRVERDVEGGLRSGVARAPTFFIEGRRHEGPLDAARLLLALRDAAARAPRRSVSLRRGLPACDGS